MSGESDISNYLQLRNTALLFGLLKPPSRGLMGVSPVEVMVNVPYVRNCVVGFGLSVSPVEVNIRGVMGILYNLVNRKEPWRSLGEHLGRIFLEDTH